MSPRLIKPIKLAVTPLVLIILLWTWLAYNGSFQKLQISFADKNAGLAVKIYRLPSADDDASPEAFMTPKYLAREIKQDSTIKLKKGKYLLATAASANYSARTQPVTLAKTTEIVEIDPDYTAAKLSALLQTEKPGLDQLISTTFPAVAGKYDIGEGKLYEHGNWYSTTLRPKQTAEERRLNYTDIYRLVARKENGTWEIITLPPELVISRLKYPVIPKNVLVDVNKR